MKALLVELLRGLTPAYQNLQHGGRLGVQAWLTLKTTKGAVPSKGGLGGQA